jgi:hypothetical protein
LRPGWFWGWSSCFPFRPGLIAGASFCRPIPAKPSSRRRSRSKPVAVRRRPHCRLAALPSALRQPDAEPRRATRTGTPQPTPCLTSGIGAQRRSFRRRPLPACFVALKAHDIRCPEPSRLASPRFGCVFGPVLVRHGPLPKPSLARLGCVWVRPVVHLGVHTFS